MPSRKAFEKVLQGHSAHKKIKLKNDGSEILLSLLYSSFLKELSFDSDKLLFMEGKSEIRDLHVSAASKKVLPKYSYASVVASRLPAVVNKTQSDDQTKTSSLSEE